MSSTLGETVRNRLSETYGNEGFMVLYLTKKLDVICDSVWSNPSEGEQRLCTASEEEEDTMVPSEVQFYILYDLSRQLILWALSPT